MLVNRFSTKFANKRIAIWGLGKEGLSTLNFLIKHELKDVAVFDGDENALRNIPSYIKILRNKIELNNYDMIVKSPGIVAQDSPEIDIQKISSQTEIFMSILHDQIIGITGTKGKSTTTTLIYHILKSVYPNTVLVGNIGIPCFDLIDSIDDKTIIVFEMSCHQLEFIKNSPHVGVLLNIYQDHLDHYKTFERYVAAKENIFRFQNEDDIFITSEKNEAQIIQANDQSQKSIIISESGNGDVCIDGALIFTPQGLLEVRDGDTKLLGKHNISNISIAYYICHDIFSVPNEEFKIALKSYEGLPHRLQYLGKLDDILYFDDSISTVPETAIVAIESLGNVGTIIVGGMDRGVDYQSLVDYLVTSNIDNVILLPDTANRIRTQLIKKGCTKNIFMAGDLAAAVAIGKLNTAKDKVCLLSPAAASYGFYKNFEERGDAYKRLIFGTDCI